MTSPDLPTRAEAAVARWKVTGDPDPSVKVLLDLLEGPPEDSDVTLALFRLEELGPAARAAVPALKRLVEQYRRDLESMPESDQRRELEWQLGKAERALEEIEGKR